MYRTADRVRAAGLTGDTSALMYQGYVEFVRAFVPAGSVLDVGCGNGWSSHWFAEQGLDATGVDLNPRAFEPAVRADLRFVEGNATRLPFPDGTFDAVAAHACLEHISNPEGALREMIRVARPGGVVCVVGPNLLSFGQSFRALTRYVWQARPQRRIIFRDAEMPRHPFGNTLPEALAYLAYHLFLASQKCLSRRPAFTMRRPDDRPPFHADNDACYLCNPIDLARYFRQRNCEVLRDAALGRPGWTRLIAGGTWIAARTPTRR
ncbi:class I SAM-dependent methyltransferase [Gemmata sp.]|uniref:class I SAM-dependent methyltransferase n=1 Tax=Gemmata sp. TaxID=1914242 RepID=UPI003F724EF3